MGKIPTDDTSRREITSDSVYRSSGNIAPPKSGKTRQELGVLAESRVRAILNAAGRKAELGEYSRAFDLSVDGWRVEVKCAEAQLHNGQPTWRFNIHRHGKLKEEYVDYYILRLESIPFVTNAVHYLLKAPLASPTISISFRSIVAGDFAQAALDFERFRTGGFGVKPQLESVDAA